MMACVGIGLAFVGLILIANPGDTQLGFGVGERWTLLSALAIAAEIILVSAFASRVDARRVTVIQLFVGSLCAFLAMGVSGEMVPAFSWVVVAATVGLGTASALIQLGMNWAQKTVSPTRATVIYTGEPIWAGLIGRIAGERLPLMALAGGALIVVGVLISELPLPGRLRRVLSQRSVRATEEGRS